MKRTKYSKLLSSWLYWRLQDGREELTERKQRGSPDTFKVVLLMANLYCCFLRMVAEFCVLNSHMLSLPWDSYIEPQGLDSLHSSSRTNSYNHCLIIVMVAKKAVSE